MQTNVMKSGLCSGKNANLGTIDALSYEPFILKVAGHLAPGSVRKRTAVAYEEQ